MDTQLLKGASMSSDAFKMAKEAEREEMQSYMDRVKESGDPHLMYHWRRPITDLKDVLETSAELYGEMPLFQQKFSASTPFQDITYAQVLDDVQALGTALIDLGLKGAHIGVIGKNCYEWAESYYAIVGGVGIVTPLDRELFQDDLEKLVIGGDLEAVITMDKHYEIFKNIMEKGTTKLRYVITVARQEHGVSRCPELGGPILEHEDEEKGLLSWHKLREHGRQLLEKGDRSFLDAQVLGSDVAEILFTSGTTGNSKGVMLTHKSLCYDAMMAQTMIKVDPGDIFFSFLPIHHSYECTATLLIGTYCGATIAFCRGLKYILKDMQEVRPHLFLAVPLVFENFYNKIMRNIRKQGKERTLKAVFKLNRVTSKVGLNLSKMVTKQITDMFGGRIRVFIVGGAAIDGSIMDFFGQMGIISVQGYGLTETAPICSLNPDKKEFIKNASAGYLFPFLKCMIYNPDENGVGEICFQGPNLMLGYYKAPEATENVIIDGWFHTGDLGYLDDDNYLFITGRQKNVIIAANGKNVFPEELEFELMKNPVISECMVYGDEKNEDPLKRGIYVVVRLDPEEVQDRLSKTIDEASDQELQQLADEAVDKMNATMPLFKKITHVILRRREFNKTTAMKIRRFIEDNKMA